MPCRQTSTSWMWSLPGHENTRGRCGDAFHPTGLAEPSIIHLGTHSNQKATLMIEPLAGRVKVFDDYVEQKTS